MMERLNKVIFRKFCDGYVNERRGFELQKTSVTWRTSENVQSINSI